MSFAKGREEDGERRRGRDEGRAPNGGHLECPKAAIVSVYALLAHTGPYTRRKTYDNDCLPFSKDDPTRATLTYTLADASARIPFKALLR